jgi:ankyrin repeat protein
MEDSRSLQSLGKRGEAAAIAALLQSGGCEVNCRDSAGRTALHEAAAAGHLQVLRMLLEHGADCNPKVRAWESTGNAAKIQRCSTICDDGFLLVAPCRCCDGCLSTQDAYMQTPLMLAAEFDHADAVSELCRSADIDVQAQDIFHRTALHWAAHKGSVRVVTQLLAAGADVNQQTTSGETALHWACSSTSITDEGVRQQIVQLLVEARANVRLKNASNDRPVDRLLQDVSTEGIRSYLQAIAEKQVTRRHR